LEETGVTVLHLCRSKCRSTFIQISVVWLRKTCTIQ